MKKRIPQDRQMIKYGVRQLLGGRVFVCFLACLIPAVLPWLLRLAPVSFGVVTVLLADTYLVGISVPMTVLSFVATAFVTDPMAVRLAGFFLTLNRDAEHLPSPLTVCDCFGPGYLRLVGGMLLRAVWVLGCTLVPLAIGALIPGTWEILEISGEQVVRIGDWGYVFLLVALVVNMWQDLALTMVPYLLADRPELSAREALQGSRKMTRGRIGELLVLQLSFFGWLMLLPVTFMLAGVYVYPYIEGTMAAYYIAYTVPLPYETDEDAA